MSAGRDRNRGFGPKIRPTPPGGIPAGRLGRPNTGSFRYTSHPMCLLKKQNPRMWTICTKLPPPHVPPAVPPPLHILRLAVLDGRLASLDAGANRRAPLKKQDNYGGHRPPCVCTALCVVP